TTLNRLNANVIALLLAKKLPASGFSLLRDYLGGNLKFAALFAGLEKSMLAGLRESWSQGRLMQALQQLVKEGMAGARPAGLLPGDGVEDFVASLQLQEMLTRQAEGANEARMYFQWPLFWQDQDLPDTLEGEAFIPDGNDPEQGFSMRLLVCPPSLGQVEVALHQLKKNLWVHFGVEETVIEQVRTIFPMLQEQLADQQWEQLRFTVGKVRLLQDFFSSAEEACEPAQKPGRIDLRA
ncbi:MAG: flagellar hook-length control protein FliK, partial [Candidatus Riflebacteria bacterium]|nr:flagellar hook-length control protein FliK [Candidatus Riflebacteria bacterium]